MAATGSQVRRWRRGRDRGDTSVEIVLFAPLMLLAVMVLFQAGAVFFADLSARHAAQQGLQTARLHGATGAEGQDAASALLEEINPNGLSDVDIVVVRDVETTTVTVTGTALPIIPVVPIQVTAQAHGPTEPAGSMSRGFSFSEGPIARNRGGDTHVQRRRMLAFPNLRGLLS